MDRKKKRLYFFNLTSFKKNKIKIKNKSRKKYKVHKKIYYLMKLRKQEFFTFFDSFFPSFNSFLTDIIFKRNLANSFPSYII
jgi:hypothetical protein